MKTTIHILGRNKSTKLDPEFISEVGINTLYSNTGRLSLGKIANTDQPLVCYDITDILSNWHYITDNITSHVLKCVESTRPKKRLT